MIFTSQFCTEKFNRYTATVGGKIGSGACAQANRENHLDEIKDETKLISYLSTSDEKWQLDWLFRVIKDIVRMTLIISYRDSVIIHALFHRLKSKIM